MQLTVLGSHQKDLLQRHLFVPSVAELQVECGQSLHSSSELQSGSDGLAHRISTSANPVSSNEEPNKILLRLASHLPIT